MEPVIGAKASSTIPDPPPPLPPDTLPFDKGFLLPSHRPRGKPHRQRKMGCEAGGSGFLIAV